MRKDFTSILVILLTLIIANTGFARADIQLCQAECEYSALNKAALPPCCKTKKTVTPVMVKVDHEQAPSSECPHYGSSREIPDPLKFASSVNTTAPQSQPAVYAIIPLIDTYLPDTRFSGYATHTGLSQPGMKTPPVYHLNCSLLI